MNDAIWGAIVGAGATTVVSVVTWLQQRSLRRLELTTDRERRQWDSSAQLRKEQREQYVRFLSAYYVTEGRLKDLRDYLVNQPAGWLEYYQSVVRDPDHEKRTIELNEGRAWIALTTPSRATHDAVTALSQAFDRLADEFQRAKLRCIAGEQCDGVLLDAAFATADAAFVVVLSELRADLGTPPLSTALVPPN